MKLVRNAITIATMSVMPFVSTFGEETYVAGELFPKDKIQKIRFLEDDAQNYMVSKIYTLKHQQANDIVPFIGGSIKRYAKNGSADRISYKAAGKQLIAVSCPIPLVPYIDDMIAKLDRPVKGNDGSGIEGTGIIRSVYKPTWRSSQDMVKIMIKAGISSNASEGAAQDAVVAYDAASNLIYWKDSINKNKDLIKYLTWLDRPVPQLNVSVNVYEVRESDLLDLGIDYLAWKNGPGLNLLDMGAVYLEGSALADAFGPYGFFAFAPSFDFSFVRLLQQNGKAQMATSAKFTVVNGTPASMSFSPDYQNLEKDEDFRSSVVETGGTKLELNINEPIIAISGDTNKKTGLLGFSQLDYSKQKAVLNFLYSLNLQNVVERDNQGNELLNKTTANGGASILSGNERLLNVFSREYEVEQTIGVPFLCELPILKYIFGTTTKSKEKVFYFVSANCELMHPDSDISQMTGTLVSVPELVNSK